jgi:hypothetical protein
MAADLVLFALPDTPENQRTLRLLNYDENFVGDQITKSSDGSVLVKKRSSGRILFERRFYATTDRIQVSPYSWMIPSSAALWDFLSQPKRITLSLIAHTMILMNVPLRDDYYQTMKDRNVRPRQLKKWLLTRQGWLVGAFLE